MTKSLNLKSIFGALAALIIMAGISSCSKDVLRPDDMMTPDQLAAGRIDGTWTTPKDIVTPPNVPAEVFGSMRLVFTTDPAGNPLKFMAHDCPIMFTNATAGTWSAAVAGDSTAVKIKGVGPVDDFKVKVSSKLMTISFYMGWENTDTKATGKGNFKVTLARQ